MLSIEEIKLLIEKLEKMKGHDFQKLINDNLKILKDLATAHEELLKIMVVLPVATLAI